MKIWFCYVNSGGGHRAPAKALANEIQRKFGASVQTELIDMAEGVSPFFSFWLEKAYLWLIQHADWLWGIVYELSRLPLLIAIDHRLSVFFVKQKFKKKIVTEKPDHIVFTYFFAEPAVQALRELQLRIPVTVVVTEPYSTPPIWFYNKSIQYVVFSEEAQR